MPGFNEIVCGEVNLFYRSFNFTEMAHQSFEITLPFAKKVIDKKIADFQRMNQKAVGSVTAGLNFFDGGIQKQVQPLASQSLSPTFS